jgi:hypothetical protein
MSRSYTKSEKVVARIFQETTGLWHTCNDACDYLDARSPGVETRNQAIAELRDEAKQGISEFTHYRTNSGRHVRLVH